MSSIEDYIDLEGMDLEEVSEIFDAFEKSLVSSQDFESVLDWGSHYCSHYFTHPPSRMHAEISDGLGQLSVQRGVRKVWIAPRGFAKSTTVTLIFALKAAVEGDEPYIIIVSDTSSQSQSFLESIRTELEDNEDLANDYPFAVGVGPTWTSKKIVLNNGVTIEALGTGNKIRGRRKKQNRPSLILVDDMENDDHIFSPTQREKARSWFNSALMKAGNKDTNVVVLGTVLHRDCLLLNLRNTPGWSGRLYRAIEKWPDRMDLWEQWGVIYRDIQNENYEADALTFYNKYFKEMNKGSVVLWPENENLYELMCMREREGHMSFESEKQNNPINPEACEFPSEWFDDPIIHFDDWPEDLTLKTIALDPSKGADARRGDYAAFVKLGRSPQGIMYIDCRMDRIPASDLSHEGIELYREFGPHGFGIETNQFQSLLARDFEQVSKSLGVMMPIFQMHNSIKKEVRIRRLSAYLSRRMFRFKTHSPGVMLLLNQLRDFPVGDHDDGPDALEMALRLAMELDNEGVGR